MADLSSNLKVFLARELQRQFSSLDNSVALFISGASSTTTKGSLASGLVDNSIEKELDTRRQLQTAKILTDSSIALMIPRVNWTSGIIYQTYSLSADNSTRNFYVYTTDGNIYVCISNGGGKQSLEEPTSTGTSLEYLGNGYVWKFMCKVPSDLIDFIDSEYIPIKELPIYDNKPFAYGSEDKQLQYAVQYTSSGSVVDSIDVSTQGSEYAQTIKSSNGHIAVRSDINTVTLDNRASGSNDIYNEYTIRIVNGTGVGQFRKITAYDGSLKIATVESNWSVLPDSTSLYEIIPTINITGDGTNATAFAKMHSYAANTIDAVVVANGGSNYSTASATVSPTASPTATVLSVYVNPIGGVGRDTVFDLLAKRISILIKIDGRENFRAVLGNDYREYGLWLSPKIGAGYTQAGKIAGTDAYIRTTVDLESTTGQTFDDRFTSAGEFLFGTESYNTGKVANVTNAFTKFSPTLGKVILDGLNSRLKNGETIHTFTTDSSSGGYTFTGKTAKVKNTLLEDSIRSSFTEVYRCSHKLGVSRTDGFSFDPGTPYTSIPFDAAATGGSGGRGIVLDFTNINGGSGDVFLSNVVSGSSSNTTGFIAGETLAVNNLELDITSVSPPELNLFSGKMLYINDIEQVTRNAEQLDLFKINFDF